MPGGHATGGRIVNDRDWSAAYKRNLAEVGEDLGGKVFVADPEVNQIGNRSWREYIKRDSLLSDIASIECPALFVNAATDIRPNWPTKQLAKLMRRGGYCEIAGAAHVIWLTHAEELRGILRRFIASITPAEQGGAVDALARATDLCRYELGRIDDNPSREPRRNQE